MIFAFPASAFFSCILHLHFTLLFHSAALASAADLHELIKGCFYITFFHSMWYFIVVQISGGLSIRTSSAVGGSSISPIDLLKGSLELEGSLIFF